MKHLCTLLVILVIICSSSVAQVSWFLKTGEARLENNETLELVCQVATGPCCSLQRRWKGGIGFSTLITNGVTSFPQKYGEIVQASSLQFSLLIYNLSVSDINVNYQCEYGFDFSLQQLSMNESIFRYVSKPDEVKILEWNYTKNQFSVAVNITRVFPLPTCIASYKGTQLTPLVKPYDNGLFKYAEVSMIYIGFECPGTLIITCAVGSHQFEVFNASPCSSCQDRKWCWICWICIIIKSIFAVLFFLVDLWRCGLREILSRKYKMSFRLEKLKITRNLKQAKIASVKMFVDRSEITQNWNISDKDELDFSNITFDKTGRYQCDVTLDKQPNFAFEFNFKGCENDRNVAKCIEFGNEIKVINGTDSKKISVQWRHCRNTGQCTSADYNIYKSENVVLYQSEGDGDDMPVIHIITFLDLAIPDLKKRVKIRIRSFIVPSCVIVLVGIITWVIHYTKFEWLCCMDWFVPVAIILTLLVIPLYGLLFILLLKIHHEWWIVEKSWKEFPDEYTSPARIRPSATVQVETSGHTDPSVHDAGTNNTSKQAEKVEAGSTRNMENSLLDKKQYKEPLPQLPGVEITNNPLPLGRGIKLDPIENQDGKDSANLVIKLKKKKKKRTEQDSDTNTDVQEDKM